MKTVSLVAVLATLAGCGWGGSHGLTFPGAPVVLISIDTLRADRLPAYGYGEVETPHIDALQRDGVLFENAYSQCPLTLPSHVSMLTGLLPAGHGVRSNLGYTFDGRAHATLARMLKAHGYATGAAVSSYVLRRATGIDDSFDLYDDSVGGDVEWTRDLSTLQRRGGETARRALAWVEGVKAKPFFLFLHIYEPHQPHEPPEPFRSRYGATYDGEVAASDAIVGDFLDALRRQGIYDRAILLLVSDHGEGLGDHGEEEHGILLYREALHVPFVLKLPGSREAGRRVVSPVGLVDVVPTITSLLGISGAPSEGRSVLDPALESAGRGIYSETYYPQIHFGWSRLRSIVDGRHHYIDGPRPELYEIVHDPGETKDIIATESGVAQSMKAELQGVPEEFAEPGHVDPEVAERLKTLGYVADTAPASDEAVLPNPRDRIQAHEKLKAASRLAALGKDDQALAALRELVAEDSRSFEARRDLAGALARLGRYEEAAAAYREAMTLSPRLATTLALPLGMVELEMGHLPEAEARARMALDEEPGRARLLLARVALARGDLAAAESDARAAMANSAAAREGALVLAQVLVRRTDLAGALAVLEEARSRAAAGGHAPPAGLAPLRADVLGRLGRFAEAEAVLREDLRSHPGRSQTYASLAVMAALQGRSRDDVHRILESMVAANPGRETLLLGAKTLDFLGDGNAARAWRRRAAASGPARP